MPASQDRIVSESAVVKSELNTAERPWMGGPRKPRATVAYPLTLSAIADIALKAQLGCVSAMRTSRRPR